MLWVMFESWEIARKIRAPEQETSYVTYSHLLGPRRAILIAICLQLGASATAIALGRVLSAAWIQTVLVAVALVVGLFANLRFLRHPTPHNARLRPFTEAFLLLFLLAQLMGFATLRVVV